MDDITYKINTWDNKKPNYSCVATKEGDKYKFVDKTYNKALSAEVVGEEYNDDGKTVKSDGTLRQEWWNVYRIYKQYHKPSIKLNLSLRNDIYIYTTLQNKIIDGLQNGPKTFIVGTVSKDYKRNKQTLTLIEKH